MPLDIQVFGSLGIIYIYIIYESQVRQASFPLGNSRPIVVRMIIRELSWICFRCLENKCITLKWLFMTWRPSPSYSKATNITKGVEMKQSHSKQGANGGRCQATFKVLGARVAPSEGASRENRCPQYLSVSSKPVMTSTSMLGALGAHCGWSA